MGKPLLTDEMIERANRGEAISGPPLYDEEETKILPTGNRGFGYERPVISREVDSGRGASYPQETIPIRVQPTVTKSRRIEEEKQSVLQSKLNKILFWIIVLLIVLIIAIWRL